MTSGRVAANAHIPFLELGRQVDALREELDGAVSSVLDEGRFVLGPRVAEFEQAFADWCGAGYCVGVASGTDALALALQAVGVRSGDEVIVPANTCVPTVAAVESLGATAVLADVDQRTFTLSHESVIATRTERTRAVVPVHLYGFCADVDAIRDAAPGLRVVEDAAQAHGAELRGRRAGTLGDAAAFSFYPTKNLGALGDAGAVVTNNSDVAGRARLLRAYGERERYTSVLSGRNSRLDEVQAAVLLVKLRYLDAWTERRRAIAARYENLLAGRRLTCPVEPDGWRHAWHLYVVRVGDRDEVRRRLASRGIETLVHYPRPMHGHPAYTALAHPGLEKSEQLAREVMSLPLYPELRDDEVESVAFALSEALSE